jgi:hypothetical protein
VSNFSSGRLKEKVCFDWLLSVKTIKPFPLDNPVFWSVY